MYARLIGSLMWKEADICLAPSPLFMNLATTPGSWTHLYILGLDNKATSAELTSALAELIE